MRSLNCERLVRFVNRAACQSFGYVTPPADRPPMLGAECFDVVGQGVKPKTVKRIAKEIDSGEKLPQCAPSCGCVHCTSKRGSNIIEHAVRISGVDTLSCGGGRKGSLSLALPSDVWTSDCEALARNVEAAIMGGNLALAKLFGVDSLVGGVKTLNAKPERNLPE